MDVRWLVLGAAAVWGGSRVPLVPGDGYELMVTMGGGRRVVSISPRAGKAGMAPLDRWLQVAPGGTAVAVGSAADGLRVVGADGSVLLQRGGVRAFRFSPDGQRLALATAKGVAIVGLRGEAETALGTLGAVEEIRWFADGLVVRDRGALWILRAGMAARRLQSLGANEPFATAGNRLVCGRGRGVVSLTLPDGAARTAEAGGVVLDVELSADGGRLLAVTATRVLLQTGDGPLTELAQAADVHTVAFGPDGGYLFAGRGGGVVSPGGRLPAGTLTANYGADGAVVVTTRDGVFRRDGATGALVVVGGIAAADGANVAGAMVGADGVAALVVPKSGWQKKRGTPPD